MIDDTSTDDTLVSSKEGLPFAPGQPKYQERLTEAANLMMGKHMFSHATTIRFRMENESVTIIITSPRKNKSFIIVPTYDDWKKALTKASK